MRGSTSLPAGGRNPGKRRIVEAPINLEGEGLMREHSGAEGKNNNRNPTLRDAERAKGRSGEAVAAERKHDRSPSRQSTAKKS